LEDNGLLDPLNELHLFALHYTFMPRINKSLQEFKRQWENHPLSPLHLCTAGMLENEHCGYATVANVFDPGSMHDYGFNPSGPFPMEEEDFLAQELKGPSILVPRPRRLRDAKRAMGTRMERIKRFTYLVPWVSLGEGKRDH